MKMQLEQKRLRTAAGVLGIKSDRRDKEDASQGFRKR